MNRDFGLMRIHHAGIHVKNLEETANWYHDVLGFELLPVKGEMPGVFPKCWLMKNGDFFLEIYEAMNAEDYSFVDYEYKIGVKHLSFSMAQLDKFADWIYERGDVTVLVDNCYPEERCGCPGGDRCMYILDNNGMLIELQKVHDR